MDSTRSSQSSGLGGGDRQRPLGAPSSFWKNQPDSSSSGEHKGKTLKKQQGGVKSIISLLSPTMREMDSMAQERGGKEALQSTSTLPLYYENGKGQENNAKVKMPSGDDNMADANACNAIRTPLLRPIVPSGSKPFDALQNLKDTPWVTAVMQKVRKTLGDLLIDLRSLPN